MMSISHSDVMPISSERSDAGLSQSETDEGLGNVVILAAFVREVKLPEVLEARGVLDSSPALDRTAFVRSVIH